MRSTFRFVGGIVALTVLTTAFATGQPNPAAKPGEVPAPPPAGELAGKVVLAGGSSKVLVVAVEMPTYELNKGAQPNRNNQNLANLMRRQADLQRRQAELMRARNPREQAQRMQQLQIEMQRLQVEMARMGVGAQQSPYKVVMKRHDYEFQTDENTRVRFLQPPVAFDEKGNPKKYTDTELKQLKGSDPKLPGYTGEFDQLRPGHVVKVAIGKKGATKSKDLDKAPLDDDKAYAAVILVTGEDTPPTQPKKKK